MKKGDRIYHTSHGVGQVCSVRADGRKAEVVFEKGYRRKRWVLVRLCFPVRSRAGAV